MKNRIHLAVVGAGWWATYAHIPGILNHPDANLAALCDQDLAKAQSAAAAFGIKHVYTSLEKMLANEDLDGVVIVTHHATHYAVARTCLDYGVNILIEKPMTLRAIEARELVERAQANSCEISVGYNANHTPFAIRARELIHSGDLGQVQLVSGTFSQHNLDLLGGEDDGARQFEENVHQPGQVYSDPERSGGGHGHLQMTHLAGMLFYLTGLRARSVSARMRNFGLAVDLVNTIQIEFQSGALASISCTSNIPNSRKITLQIYCERGWIDIDESGGQATFHRASPTPPESFTVSADPDYYRFVTTDNFIQQLQGLALNRASGEIGWRAVELLEASYRSALRGGEPVSIPSLYDMAGS